MDLTVGFPHYAIPCRNHVFWSHKTSSPPIQFFSLGCRRIQTSKHLTQSHHTLPVSSKPLPFSPAAAVELLLLLLALVEVSSSAFPVSEKEINSQSESKAWYMKCSRTNIITSILRAPGLEHQTKNSTSEETRDILLLTTEPI